MLIPKGQPIHENLSTVYTQFDGMLNELLNDHFTGYLRVQSPEYEGILLFENGAVTWAADEVKGEPHRGAAAAQTIAAKGKEKGGLIGVYRLPQEQVSLLAGIGQGDLVHKNLTSDLTALDNLIANLQTRGHTGYVEVNVNGAKGAGLLLLQAGKPVATIFSTDGETFEEDKATSRMVEVAAKVGATFNIYSTSIEKTKTGASKVSAVLDLPQLLQIWSALISSAEQVADGLSTKGHFIDTFKRTLGEKAAAFPVLHPISSEFQYKDGHITFNGNASENLSEGLSACLSAATSKLADETPKANLTVRVKAALQQVEIKHVEAFQKFDLVSKLDLLRMNDFERVLAVAAPYLGNNTTSFLRAQCSDHLGLVPEELTADKYSKLAQRVEKSAALLISREQAQELSQKIEALAKSE